jgi:hypothetical protein
LNEKLDARAGHTQVEDCRQLIGHFLGQAVGDDFLVWISREVRKRQHRDGLHRRCGTRAKQRDASAMTKATTARAATRLERVRNG